MGACAQIAVFTYAVMRRTPRYEIRLAASFADNLMNSEAHCGELPINVERPPVPILLPQSGHRRQEQAPLYPSSASAWAQMIGASFSVPFFHLNVGTGDRIKLLCTLLPPQRGHR